MHYIHSEDNDLRGDDSTTYDDDARAKEKKLSTEDCNVYLKRRSTIICFTNIPTFIYYSMRETARSGEFSNRGHKVIAPADVKQLLNI
mmetsp:Transcript_28035/g.47536  ORF Transcript_28035/g.47536 Transcript_28035/m.47536 type:complete len:88 (+) Transcript_28035:370-633(+)